MGQEVTAVHSCFCGRDQRRQLDRRRWLRLAIVSCAVGVVWFGGGTSSTAADWPQWRGADGSGVSIETEWVDRFGPGGPRVLWERQVGVGYASVSVLDGRLYTAGWTDGEDIIYCMDAESGKPSWQDSYSMKRYDRQHEGGPAGTPAVSGDRVYTLSREANLFCLNAETGKILWRKDLMSQFGTELPRFAFTGSPAVYGDTLFVDVGRIIAFDKVSGDVVWQSRDYGSAYSTPVLLEVGRRRLLAAFPQYGLVVLDASTGLERAVHEWKNPYGNNAAMPVVDGNRIFISSADDVGGVLLELADQGLRDVWHDRQMRNKMATSVLWNDHLYGFDKAVLKCVDMADGTFKWSQRGLGMGSLIAAGGKLIVLSEDGELIIAEAAPQSFNVRARAKVLDAPHCWTAPVLADGRIYCRSSVGQLVCVDVRAGSRERE